MSNGKVLIKFGCRPLPAGKVGILTPDEDGYYTLPLGGFDLMNESGVYYNRSQQVINLFNESSSLMRRIKRGVLCAELGHPKLLPGMTAMDLLQRSSYIEETRICAHFSEIWLVEGTDPTTGKPALLTYGKAKPYGPYGHVFEDAVKNRMQNVCFSIRSTKVDSIINGRIDRTVDHIFTWDLVNEPGVRSAEKYHSMALESFRNDLEVKEESFFVPASVIQQATANNAMAFESNEELKAVIGTIKNMLSSNTKRVLTKW